ncbi:MAG: LuxR C-terminal-related transcriptional regulator [Actinobacteria bacterium]|nr:LuxR C-terminal-related transcriptional regulator [Actinomycetota bacterium]
MGRDDELRQLSAAVARLAAGRGGVVLVEGQAGLGKSRVIDAGVVTTAREAGVRHLVGRIFELTATRPFGLVSDLLLDVEELDVAGLSASDLPVDAAADVAYRVVDAVRSTVAKLAADAALVLVAEDIHDADAGSLLALHDLVHVTAEVPLLLVLSRRLHPASDEVLAVVERIRDVGGVVLALEPLSEQHVADLLTATLGAAPGPRLLELTGRAAGNPLFVTELVAGLLEEQALRQTDGTIELEEPVLPASLTSTILRRLRSLDPRSRALLRDAAVLGTSFRIDDLARSRGDDPVAVADGLAPAFSAGFLVDDGDRAAFRHALVRDAVYEDISSAVRATLHVRAGRWLAERGAPASDVAYHLAIGATSGDDEAVSWLRRAAEEAAPVDPRLAVERLQRALELTPADRPAVHELRVALARCLLWSGRLAEAGETAEHVLARPAMSPPEEAEARFVLARVLAYRGRIPASIEQVQLALREGLASGARRAQLLADLALRRGLDGDLPGADDAARRALVAGQELADSLTVRTARCALAWNAALRGEAAAALAYAERAVRSPGHTDAVEPVQARLYLGFARLHAGDLAGARVVLEDVHEQGAQLGAVWAAGLAHSLLAIVGWLAGDWDGAASAARDAVAAAEAGAARTWLPLAAAGGALVAASRGEREVAARLLAAGEEVVAVAGGIHVGAGLLGLARARLTSDGSVEGRRSALQADVAYGAYTHVPFHLLDAPIEQLAAIAGPRGVEVLEDLASEAAGAALARSRAGDDTDALVAAATTLGSAGLVFHQARVGEDAAVALARAGRSAEASALADETLSSYAALAADAELDRCRARFRDAGLRPGVRGARRRPATGWASLTPAEIRVARLVAEGLTNPDIADRLYVSRRTVESHVSSVLRKLSLSSRVELAVLVADRGAGGPGSP